MGKFKEIDNVELRILLNEILNNLNYTFIDFYGNTCKLSDINFKLKFVVYSETKYGSLRHNKFNTDCTPTLTIILFEDSKGKTPRNYDDVVDTFLHELAHLIQYKKGELICNGKRREVHGEQFRIYENELKESYKRYLKEDV